MSEEMLKITNDFLHGVNEDARQSIEMSKTDEELYDVIRILNECRNRLLDHNIRMLNGKKEKVI